MTLVSVLKQETSADVDEQLGCSPQLAVAAGAFAFILYSFWIVIR